MNRHFWKNKKVLLTGHTGFKGSWLSLWLQLLEANLVGYSLEPQTDPSLFTIAHVADEMTSVMGNILDIENFKKTVQEHKPEIVIHMAAQALVRESYADPVTTYATNVMGTINILEAVRECDSVKVVLNITTDKCYENKEWVWGYRENDAIGGHDPYSNSKGCAELVTSAYRNSFFHESNVALASGRAGNVIGGGDWSKDRLIPDLINAFHKQEVPVIRSPKATRPWQHVLEPLNGYLTLVEHLYNHGKSFAEGWNFGPLDDDCKPVNWIADKLVRFWGNQARWELDEKTHPHEANFLKLDCSKATAKLGWIPKLSLEDALDWTVKWYQSYFSGEPMKEVTQKEILKYENKEK